MLVIRPETVTTLLLPAEQGHVYSIASLPSTEKRQNIHQKDTKGTEKLFRCCTRAGSSAGQSHEIATAPASCNQSEPKNRKPNQTEPRGTEQIPFLTGRETTGRSKGLRLRVIHSLNWPGEIRTMPPVKFPSPVFDRDCDPWGGGSPFRRWAK